MSTDAPLPRPVRQFIVLLALLQGLLLYIADYGTRNDWWPFNELGGRVCWYTLVLAVPGAMLLSVRDLADRRFWQHAALVAIGFGALAAYVAWSATGDPAIDSGEVLGPFGVTACIALFIALPYLQARLEHGRWCAPYGDLFENAWQNAITLALTGLFVGIVWGVLALWGELFKLIGIHFFADLFKERPFAYLATGCMVGLGILIGRTQHRAVQIARQILLAIGKGLLPLLALIALLFVVALPFTGLEALWKTKRATAILLWLIVLMIGFVNAVYQEGGKAAPYPRPLRLAVEAALLTLPIYAALAIYALWLRYGQYGWTGDRFMALLVAIVLAAYALGYAWSVVRRQTWQPAFGRINVALSLGVIGLVVLMNTPPLDPHRIGVSSQMARLHEPGVKANPQDITYLRFDAGRRGVDALKALRAEPAIANDTSLAQQIDEKLARKQRWGVDAQSHKKAATLAEARANVTLAPGTEPLDDAWLQALIDAQETPPYNCVGGPGECIALSPDLDADGKSERLLCDLREEYNVTCGVWTLGEGRWQSVGNLRWQTYGDKNRPVREAIRVGKFEVNRRRWSDIVVAGDSASVSP
jgi:hypothetical protein